MKGMADVEITLTGKFFDEVGGIRGRSPCCPAGVDNQFRVGQHVGSAVGEQTIFDPHAAVEAGRVVDQLQCAGSVFDKLIAAAEGAGHEEGARAGIDRAAVADDLHRAG